MQSLIIQLEWIKHGNKFDEKGVIDMEKIIQANEHYLEPLTHMAMDLWPGHGEDEMKNDFVTLLRSENNRIFLLLKEEETVGFVHFSIRTDYVEGSTSSPTGYVDGIYVKPDFRRMGLSKRLIKTGESWLKEKGCHQIASDIEWTNDESYRFHKGIGFKETNRLITFIKELD